jgi:hypothetical protein
MDQVGILVRPIVWITCVRVLMGENPSPGMDAFSPHVVPAQAGPSACAVPIEVTGPRPAPGRRRGMWMFPVVFRTTAVLEEVRGFREIGDPAGAHSCLTSSRRRPGPSAFAVPIEVTGPRPAPGRRRGIWMFPVVFRSTAALEEVCGFRETGHPAWAHSCPRRPGAGRDPVTSLHVAESITSSSRRPGEGRDPATSLHLAQNIMSPQGNSQTLPQLNHACRLSIASLRGYGVSPFDA